MKSYINWETQHGSPDSQEKIGKVRRRKILGLRDWILVSVKDKPYNECILVGYSLSRGWSDPFIFVSTSSIWFK